MKSLGFATHQLLQGTENGGGGLTSKHKIHVVPVTEQESFDAVYDFFHERFADFLNGVNVAGGDESAVQLLHLFDPFGFQAII